MRQPQTPFGLRLPHAAVIHIIQNTAGCIGPLLPDSNQLAAVEIQVWPLALQRNVKGARRPVVQLA